MFGVHQKGRLWYVLDSWFLRLWSRRPLSLRRTNGLWVKIVRLVSSFCFSADRTLRILGSDAEIKTGSIRVSHVSSFHTQGIRPPQLTTPHTETDRQTDRQTHHKQHTTTGRPTFWNFLTYSECLLHNKYSIIHVKYPKFAFNFECLFIKVCFSTFSDTNTPLPPPPPPPPPPP